MITGRAKAWDISKPGEVWLHADARRHGCIGPATVITYRITANPIEAKAKEWPGPWEFFVDIFRAPQREAICIIPPNAPEWAEDVIAQSFSHDGKPLRQSQEVTP